MQTVRVRLFARFRDLAGTDVIELSVPHDATVGDVRRALASRNLGAEALLARSRIAVNGELAGDSRPVRIADEIALIPPVSGG